MVEVMTDLLELKPDDVLLGLGYQAAVLAELAGRVYSVEIIDELLQIEKTGDEACVEALKLLRLDCLKSTSLKPELLDLTGAEGKAGLGRNGRTD
jgi:protein-L-isoaspartate O-methyltransferase